MFIANFHLLQKQTNFNEPIFDVNVSKVHVMRVIGDQLIPIPALYEIMVISEEEKYRIVGYLYFSAIIAGKTFFQIKHM